jgi:hypothetical protein
MSITNATPGIPLVIEGIFSGRGFEFALPKLAAGNGRWRMIISKDADGLYPVLTLIEGAGLKIYSTTINISAPVENNILKSGKYFFKIIKEFSNNTTLNGYYGSMYVNNPSDIVAYKYPRITYVAQGNKGLDGASNAIKFSNSKAEADGVIFTAGELIWVASDDTENGDSAMYLVLPDLTRQKILILNAMRN